MTISVKHAFQSAKGDGTDATLVQPTNWNAEHTLLCATDRLLGRTTAGSGAVEEIAISDFMQSLLNSANLAALLTAMGAGAFTTGDVKPTYKTTADTGWVMMNDGSIGDGSSGGTTRANSDCSALFTSLYDNITALVVQDSSGSTVSRGANAAADFAAHRRLVIPKALGRALVAAGAGSGLTSRTLGAVVGEETHTLITSEIPAHSHAVTDPGHDHAISGNAAASGLVSGASPPTTGATLGSALDVVPATTGISINNAGGDGAHNNMQPSTFINFMIKL